ncbi:uncharacterized protein PHACADRAFT_209595 [Phanerochaete carnosa HHB-10118-sp]|uniref:Pyridoxamine kinase/Phosphomethylpyrimidine kinase domain-containing protein n=1 Tax=Phanerochaete carnosa (strain HHB-10118-sp) TaxID=650164 RepID=K5VWZ9_PHACS|nr:uncharacterized protein PHACADRAFT_209595 [Phanerochaete carnosa HHB-10118-sp]EKM56098.1 hypothetical protein PHACADRAFT_209595 [Phanerochaete carnosa HHB-10118-sp]
MSHTTVKQPAVLTIAGSDSSGGAGIQADLKTFTAHLCYGTSVIVALTAQNTTGVQAVHALPPEFVEQQLRSVLDDVEIKAMKTGMLFDAKSIRAVVRILEAHYDGRPLPLLVCDPVCVSTSGHTLLQADAVEVLIEELLPLTFLVTPNKSEAELMLSHRGLPSSIESLEDILRASSDLLKLGPQAALLKGGHLTVSMDDVERVSRSRQKIRVVRDILFEENMEILQVAEKDLASKEIVVDVLHTASGTTLFIRPRVDSTSTHGTGCTLSAALVCALARGETVETATRNATVFTHLGIETAQPIGEGYGPLNHIHSLTVRSIPQSTSSNPHPFTRLLIQSTSEIWKEYVEHEFVKKLARGTLPRESFLHFIKQDYLYLRYYARAYALLAAKSSTFAAIKTATDTIMNVINEVATHKSFCAKWGISEEELSATPESPATTAYGAYLLDIGLQGDTSKLIVACAACLLGYGEVGLWLKKEAERPSSWVVLEGNPYKQWMYEYGGADYQQAVRVGIETIEAMAQEDPPSPVRFEEWKGIWERCTRLEKGFWDMAMNLA